MTYLGQKTKKDMIREAFGNNPKVVFSPATVALTTGVLSGASKRICQELNKEGFITLIVRGYYQLNKDLKA